MGVFIQLGLECPSSRVPLKSSTISRFSGISVLVDLAVLAGPYVPQAAVAPLG